MKNKKLLFIIIFLLLLLVAFLVYFFFFKGKNSTSNNSNSSNNSSNTLTENSVKCDVDNQKDVTYKMFVVNSYKDPTSESTLFMANENTSAGKPVHVLQFSFPGKTVINYTLNPEDSNVGLHYSDGTTTSYQTNADNGDTFQINVTKYEGNKISGTFSGEMTEISTNGWNMGNRMSLKNCSFTSNMEIKPL